MHDNNRNSIQYHTMNTLMYIRAHQNDSTSIHIITAVYIS